MTVQEMHIDLDLQLQKINSNVTENILPNEKDWFLNNEVTKFLNDRTRDISNRKRRGFEEDTKRLKDIQPLIKRDEVDVEYINNKEGRFILPSFNYKIIRTDCIFFKKCEESKYEEKIKIKKVYKFKFKKEESKNIKLNISINNISNIVFTYSYFNKNKSYFNLINAFKNKAQQINNIQNNYKIYFEYYGNEYEQDCFFVEGLDNLTDVSIAYESISLEPNKDNNDFNTVSNINNTFTTKNITTYISKKEIKRTGRTVNEELEGFKVNSSISKSVLESPLVSFERGFGFVYHPKNTIIKKVDFVYICEPVLIDIDLNQSLNLHTDICKEIVSNSVRFIKSLIGNNDYNRFVNENTLIE